MSTDGSDDDEIAVEADGIHVRKTFSADDFPVPAIRFQVSSDREETVSVRISEEIPEGFPMDGVGFHPEYESENWTAFQDHHVEYERTIDPEEDVETVYGIRIDDPEEADPFLTEPEIAEISPEGEDIEIESSSATVDETTIDDIAPEESDQVVKDMISGDADGVPGLEDEEDVEVSPEEEAEPATATAEAGGEGGGLDLGLDDVDLEADPEADEETDEEDLPDIDLDLEDAEPPEEDAPDIEIDVGDAATDADEAAAGDGPEDEEPILDIDDEPTAGEEADDDEPVEAEADDEPGEAEADDEDATEPGEAEADDEPVEAEADDEDATEPGEAPEVAIEDDGEELEETETAAERADAGDGATAQESQADTASTAEAAGAAAGAEGADTAEPASGANVGEPVDAQTQGGIESVAAALASELRAGTVSEEDKRTLKEELDLGTSSSVDARLDHLQSRVEDVTAYADALEEFLDENGTGQELIDGFQADVESLQSEVDDLGTTLSATDEDLSAVETDVDDLSEDVADATEDLEHLEADVGDVESRVEEVDAAIDNLEESLTGTIETVEADLEELAEDVEDDIDEFDDDLDEFEDDLEAIQERVEEVGGEVEEIQEWRDQLGEMFS